MPCVLRNENRIALLDSVPRLLQHEGPIAVDHIERLVHFEMAMHRDSHSGKDLLRSHREAFRTSGGIGLDEDVSATLDKMLALVGLENIAGRVFWLCVRGTR